MIEKAPQEVHKVKKEMGGINSKGIHNNFSNEYNGFVTAFNVGGIGEVENLVKELKAEGIDFRIKEYSEGVNDENREEVEKINKLIFELNDLLSKTGELNEKEFARIVNDLNFLIYERHDEDLDVKLS